MFESAPTRISVSIRNSSPKEQRIAGITAAVARTKAPIVLSDILRILVLAVTRLGPTMMCRPDWSREDTQNVAAVSTRDFSR